MQEILQVPTDLKVAINARDLLALLKIAGRAPMLEAEQLWLDGLTTDIATRAANLMEQRRVERQKQEAADFERAQAEEKKREEAEAAAEKAKAAAQAKRDAKAEKRKPHVEAKAKKGAGAVATPQPAASETPPDEGKVGESGEK